MVCTGKEARLIDCYFPENFGAGDGGNESIDSAADLAPPLSIGLSSRSCNAIIDQRLSVICRRFEITGVQQVCEKLPRYDRA